MAGAMKLACLVVLCLALATAPFASAITCGQVTTSVAPCLGYLQKGGMPSRGCCSGVKGIFNSAKTTADKQAVCKCLKGAAGQIPGLNQANAQSLPSKCGVSIPYKISTSTNCATSVSILLLYMFCWTKGQFSSRSSFNFVSYLLLKWQIWSHISLSIPYF